MNVVGTSEVSLRSSNVRYPFSESHLSPAVAGALPPASLRSTATNRATPGPSLAEGDGSGGGAPVAPTSSSLSEGELSRRALVLGASAGLVSRSAAGG